jgi:hypothetical protein
MKVLPPLGWRSETDIQCCELSRSVKIFLQKNCVAAKEIVYNNSKSEMSSGKLCVCVCGGGGIKLPTYKWVMHDNVLSVCPLLAESRFVKLILTSHACHEDSRFHSEQWHKDRLDQAPVHYVILERVNKKCRQNIT